MTREQREAIAKAVGSLWAVATVIAEDKVAEAVINTADDLDKILTEDIRAAEEERKAAIESFLKSPAHIVCNDSCTFDDGSKVDET